MTREELIKSAQALIVPSADARQAFSAHRKEMVAQVNQQMCTRKDIDELVGSAGLGMSEDNNQNFSLFMESLINFFHPEVLVDTVLWVFRTYRAHGFHTSYWPANLNTWQKVLEKNLSNEATREILPFYTWLINSIPIFVKKTDSIEDTTTNG